MPLVRPLLSLVLIAAAGALPIKKATYKEHRKDCRLRVDYPRTGQPRIDAELDAWVAGFKGACDDDPSIPADRRLDGPIATAWTPTIIRNDDQVFAVSFEQAIDADQIHDDHRRETFNFLRPDGWRVYLPEIFEPAGLRKISELAIAALEKELGGGDDLDRDMITAGAGPNWHNFSAFILGGKTLDLYFASDTVGGYADGPQEIALPLAQLTPFFRKDWRAPAPSFECAKAQTAIERAICSDVPLARRDRDLDQKYTAILHVTPPAKREALRQAQRAWRQQRDATCASAAAAALVTCLDKAYGERISALSHR